MSTCDLPLVLRVRWRVPRAFASKTAKPPKSPNDFWSRFRCIRESNGNYLTSVGGNIVLPHDFMTIERIWCSLAKIFHFLPLREVQLLLKIIKSGVYAVYCIARIRRILFRWRPQSMLSQRRRRRRRFRRYYLTAGSAI